MMDVSYHIVLQMTNLDGKRLYKDDWKQIDETEFHAYINLLILAGVYKSHGEATNSLWNTENGRPIFFSVMSLDNFQRISRIIRFDDLHAEKVWTLYNAKTSYAWSMQIYTGKRSSLILEKNQVMPVMLHLTAGLKENNVTCDNFFTSHELAMQLLKTIKKNKPELPQEVLELRGRAVHSSKFEFTEQCTVVSYIPKKHRMVLVRSTMQKDASLSTGEGCKPEMILDHDATKGGVDNMDKMLASYTCQRMTDRWPPVIFYIIDVSANNGYLLWTNCNPEWNVRKMYRRRLYLEEVGKALKVQREEQGTSQSTVQATSNKKRSRCQLCDVADNKTSTRRPILVSIACFAQTNSSYIHQFENKNQRHITYFINKQH
ncbi:hypothetical protein T10_6890 [Trichinella papuae]|uniref:PiggyBac transposable element-derived protein domain-containing protein n=1 Tax=Trichinella papuae TaxID=268474 RepID=A0A0V1MTC5_9BILA|nr:hypothetical protein T10_6890 [Trichinella papuae]